MREAAAASRIDRLISIGAVARTISDAARAAGLENATNVADHATAAELLSGIASPGDLVLIKGSRSARTELVMEEFGKRAPAEVNA